MTNEERAELDRLRQLELSESLPIAGKAWNAIKKSDDNGWINLPVSLKGKLIHLATKALAGRPEAEGDYAPEGFFAKVLELGVAFGAISSGHPVVIMDQFVFGDGDGSAPELESMGLGPVRSIERRVGLPSRRVNDTHLNLENFPDSERRVGLLDRRGAIERPTE